MITGTALLELGSAPYLAGSMKNFLSGVDLSTGMVKGCLTPDGATPTIYHAKPVLIQGAWIGAKHSKPSAHPRARVAAVSGEGQPVLLVVAVAWRCLQMLHPCPTHARRENVPRQRKEGSGLVEAKAAIS